MADEEAGETTAATEDHGSSESPPKYSMVTRMRDAKQDSSSKFGFGAAMVAIFVGSVGCAICLGVLTLLPISMIVMGAIFLDDCPAQYLIPIYLLVGGVVSVWLDLSGVLQSCCEQKKKDSQPSAFTRFCKFSESIIGTFMLVWFICGNVWIYGTYGEFTTDNPGNSTYCHPTLYWYAFWLTTAGYILAGLFLVIICVGCCVAMCCLGSQSE